MKNISQFFKASLLFISLFLMSPTSLFATSQCRPSEYLFDGALLNQETHEKITDANLLLFFEKENDSWQIIKSKEQPLFKAFIPTESKGNLFLLNLKCKPQEKFDLVIYKEGFQAKRLHFTSKLLKEKKIAAFRYNLGEIYLTTLPNK